MDKDQYTKQVLEQIELLKELQEGIVKAPRGRECDACTIALTIVKLAGKVLPLARS